MQYKESDLVLDVSKNVNPAVWDEGFFQEFFELLFGNVPSGSDSKLWSRRIGL